MCSYHRTEESLKAKVSEGEALAAKNSSLQTELKGRDAIIADLQVTCSLVMHWPVDVLHVAHRPHSTLTPFLTLVLSDSRL